MSDSRVYEMLLSFRWMANAGHEPTSNQGRKHRRGHAWTFLNSRYKSLCRSLVPLDTALVVVAVNRGWRCLSPGFNNTHPQSTFTSSQNPPQLPYSPPLCLDVMLLFLFPTWKPLMIRMLGEFTCLHSLERMLPVRRDVIRWYFRNIACKWPADSWELVHIVNCGQ